MSGALIGALRVALGLDTAAFEQGVKRSRDIAKRGSREIATGFDGMADAALRVGANVAKMAAGYVAIGSVVKVVFDSTREMQRLNAQLEVATGSAKAAGKAFDDLTKFATATPFTLAEITEAYIKLRNLGIEPTNERLLAFGNISAGMGKPMMQFAEAVADAATGSMERLKEFGITARKEGDAFEFTFQGVKETVAFNAESIVEYLTRIGKVNFAGAMEKQASTLDGKMSNLSDAAASLGRTLGGIGVSDAAITGIETMTRALQVAEKVAISLRNAVRIVIGQSTKDGVAGAREEYEAARAARMDNERRLKSGGVINRLLGGNTFALQMSAQKEAAALANLRSAMAAESAGKAKPASSTTAPAAGGGGGGGRGAGGAGKPAAPSWLQQARSGAFDNTGWSDPEGLRIVSEETMAQVRQVALDIGQIAVDVPRISGSDLFKADLFAGIAGFAEDFARSIGQAVVFSGDIGKALVNSLKAAGAELITSGIMNLLLGKRGPGGGRSGGLLGSLLGIPGFAGGTNSAPGGLAMVGERGREIVELPAGARVRPNFETERLLRGGGAGGGDIRVFVSASELFDVRVEQIGAAAGAGGGLQVIRQVARPAQPASLG